MSILKLAARFKKIIASEEYESDEESDEEYYLLQMTEEEREEYYTHKFIKSLQKVTNRYPKGTLLMVSEVREEAGIPKEIFDEIALRYSKNGTIVLHNTDYPFGLSEKEKNDCIKNKDTYYIGMAIKQIRD